MRKAKPRIVVIELGGHDYLEGFSREDTSVRLTALIKAAREAGAEVVLFEIPRGFVRNPYRGLERELAHTYGLELVPDTAIRKLVLFADHGPLDGLTSAPPLSDDGIHPNPEGCRMLAGYVANAIERICGPGARRIAH